MKLRIKGDSIRLRLTRSEVEGLIRDRVFEETTNVGPSPDGRLVYAVELVDGQIGASFEGGRLAIHVPAAMAEDWALSQKVGIEASIETIPGRTLDILIEKDFACLTRDNEDPAEHYPHPKGAAHC